MSNWRQSWFKGLFLVSVFCLSFYSPLIPADADDQVCTLADHIRSANTNTAVGFCPAGTSHDIITIADDITLTEPLPPITGTITIEGGGHAISGGNGFPIFLVEGGRLTINNLTLTESPSVGSHRDGWRYGGAIRITAGAAVNLNQSLVSRNGGSGGFGGAISVDGSKLAVNNSNFTANNDGAISAHDSQLTVNNSSFVSNKNSAIILWGSESEIRNSSFVGNRKEYLEGGAIFVGQGVTLNVSNSAFSGNRAAGGGGAVATKVTTMRGIIPSKTTLTHVTIDSGSGYGKGAGFNILVDPNDQNFKLRNSIIVGKGSPYRVETVGSCHGPLRENSGNWIEDGSCASGTSGDAMLADITGSPGYFPLLDGSPALDAADARYCTETDQVGTPRPAGVGCDIGAIESTTAIPVPTPVPGICPLPDQIIAANTDRAVGSCAAGSGADFIEMTRDYKLGAKLPPITSEISLDGNGYTISGDNLFGIFEVDGGSLTIRNVTLIRGNASRGGAISLKNGGIADVADVTFWENSAFFGGAIATESVGDRLAVSNSNFVENSAETSGGAISVDGGRVDVSGSAFHENRAGAAGGAVAALSGQAAISNSTVNGNSSVKGGGIYVNGGEATLTHLTLMNNRAERVYGAGIYHEGGALNLRNSIVALSGSGDDCYGSLNENRGNLSQDGTCATEIIAEPLLAALVESPAHFPLGDASPAHGAADPAFCLPTDQLGSARAHCDIGAIESARDPNYAVVPAPGLPDECTLADQIIAANTDAPAGACPAGDGADVIRLRQDITLEAPLPPITDDLAIDGRGYTISGDSRFPILDIESGNVVIKYITLSNGANTGEDPAGFGGVITLRNLAQLTIVQSTFRDSEARYGGAVASIDGSRLYIFDSSFLDNQASSEGGALWRDGECAYIHKVTFRRNITGELPGGENDDYLTHMNFGSTCEEDPEVYTLSDS